jgi:hypothetical protein
MAQTARKLNFMIENNIADELEKLVPAGQRSKIVSQAIANELTLQRRKNVTARLIELRAQMPKVSAIKLHSDLAEDRNRG